VKALSDPFSFSAPPRFAAAAHAFSRRYPAYSPAEQQRRIVARMAADVRGQLDAPYAFRNDGTVYTRWGDWIAELSVAVSMLLLAWVSLPGKRAPAPRRGRKGKKK